MRYTNEEIMSSFKIIFLIFILSINQINTIKSVQVKKRITF